MSLAPGTSIGPYLIVREIGRGGMGVVYLARDPRLDRDVAIKALPEHLAQEPERLARFQSEARILAQLNNPGVAGIHGIEEIEGRHFLILEYVEGESLGERLDRGALPIDEALETCAKIASGLEAAHEAGVIHRDLKPDNVRITPDYEVKVLDFGLAKSAEESSGAGQDPSNSHSPTMTTPLAHSPTMPGMILGTAAYMSPEQARGRRLDKRTDIWSFGVVLFECLTGRNPFRGETVSDTLARVLERDPDWDSLPPGIPPQVRALLRKCLQKDPTHRLRDIGDARIDVLDLMTESGRFTAVVDEAPTSPGRPYVVAASVVLGAVAIAVSLFFASRTELAEPESPVRHYSINLSPDAPLQRMAADGSGTDMALSPDGSLLVYVADTGPNQQQLFLRRLDQPDDARPLAGSENAVSVFFSPDSQWIGFFTRDKLKKVSVQGGAPVTLCDVSADRGATWGDDGDIVFSLGLGHGVKRISAAGGPVEDLLDESFMQSHGLLMAGGPIVLPGGKSLLFTAVAGFSWSEIQIAALSLETGEVKFLVEEAVSYGYHPTGHLIYGQPQALMAVPFAPGTLEITGPAIPVTQADMELQPGIGFPILFGFSKDGTLVYVPDSGDPPKIPVARTLVWVDREGNEEPIHAPSRDYREVDLSPDGTHVAVRFNDPLGFSDQEDIWILDLTREPVTQQRLTHEPTGASAPVWTPDGQQIVFGSLRDGAFHLSSKAANGTGPVETLHVSRNPVLPYAWSAKGSLIFHQIMDPSSSTYNNDLWVLSFDGEPSAHPLMAESYGELHPAISRDGRWIAYETHEIKVPGGHDIYVRPFPNIDDGKWLISTRGGEYPVWAPDGRELYYWSYSGQMTAVTLETEPAFAVGNSEELFGGEYLTFTANRPFEISPDGKRFLMIREDSQAQEAAEAVEAPPITEFVVVDNWDEAFKP